MNLVINLHSSLEMGNIINIPIYQYEICYRDTIDYIYNL